MFRPIHRSSHSQQQQHELLPSERKSLQLSIPTTPATTTPTTTTKSRNDLFSFNWSHLTPNLSPPPLHHSQLLPHFEFQLPSTTTTTTPYTPPTPAPPLPFLTTTVPFPQISPISPPSPQEPTLASIAGQSSNPLLDSRQGPPVRLSPTREFILGEGRHASVYLASYYNKLEEKWELCAAKRLGRDRDSQVAGLGEAFILSKLNEVGSWGELGGRGSKHVVKLLGVKDERDGVEAVDLPPATTSGTSPSSRSSTPTTRRTHSLSISSTNSPISQEQLWLHPNGSTGGGSPRSSTLSLSLRRQHRRSSLAVVEDGVDDSVTISPPPIPLPPTNIIAPIPTATPPTHPHLSQPPVTPTSQISTIPFPASSPQTPSYQSTNPRIILLLEYHPLGNLMTFIKQFPDRITKKRFLTWFKELTEAVAWTHDCGVLHSDLKPQNVLVSSSLSLHITDFSTSLFLPPPPSPQPSDPLGLGTLSYSPPEFVHPPPSPFSYPSDIFSLGVTLNVLLTGIEPYENVRGIERTFFVGEGGYWDWSERRRRGEGMEMGGVSRSGSLRGGGGGVSRNSSLREGTGAGRKRSESVESGRSGRSARSFVGEEWVRGSYGTWVLANRLLVGDEGAGGGGSLPTSPIDQGFFLPPEDDEEETTTTITTEQQEQQQIYSDGSIVQYYVGEEVIVEESVRELIRDMCEGEVGKRPTAREVLRRLEVIMK